MPGAAQALVPVRSPAGHYPNSGPPAPVLTGACTLPIFTHMGEYKAEQLDRVFSALGDPTRRAILARLSTGDARVTDLAAGFSISLNSVSKHIRALERAGLLRRRIMGREHVLSIAPEPLADVASWIDHYRRFWEGRLADLETFVLEKRRKRQ